MNNFEVRQKVIKFIMTLKNRRENYLAARRKELSEQLPQDFYEDPDLIQIRNIGNVLKTAAHLGRTVFPVITNIKNTTANINKPT